MFSFASERSQGEIEFIRVYILGVAVNIPRESIIRLGLPVPPKRLFPELFSQPMRVNSPTLMLNRTKLFSLTWVDSKITLFQAIKGLVTSTKSFGCFINIFGCYAVFFPPSRPNNTVTIAKYFFSRHWQLVHCSISARYSRALGWLSLASNYRGTCFLCSLDLIKNSFTFPVSLL